MHVLNLKPKTLRREGEQYIIPVVWKQVFLTVRNYVIVH
jgi:hypothetical protein